MPLTYPLTLPSAGVREIVLRQRTRVGEARSPFTMKRQVYPWAAQWLEAEVTLPPMKRATAEAWIAFLVGLNGKEGTFLLGDTANRTPRDGGLSAGVISPTLRNGGFETAGAGGGDVFANWDEFTGGSSAIVRDTVTKYAGSAACRFDTDGSATQVRLNQSVVTAGKRYRATFRARGSTAGVQLLVQNVVNVIATVTLTASWAQYTVEWTAANTYIEFASGPQASANMWIDDLSVYSIDTYGGLVNGAGQSGTDLQTDGWLASQTNIMSAGDWIQLGTGSSARLHKVLQGANSNASGEATLLIWPKLRASPADNAAVIVENPVGLFALADNEVEWSIDAARVYGLSFRAVEVVA